MIYLVFLILLVIIVFNVMKKKSNNVRVSYSTMDVYLKKRYDLIPNLVNCVKGYSEYEANTLNELLKIRDCSINDLLVNMESYAKLRADSVFINLQKNLNDIEEQISAARRSYNAAVNDYNSFISFVPFNLIAKMFKFKPYELFSVEDRNTKVVDINE